MNLLNKAQADALFQREAVMIGGIDIVPAARVVELFGAEALEYVRRCNERVTENYYSNTYGVAGELVEYVTVRGFCAAVTCHNVFLLNGKSAKEAQP